jgi:flagellar biosynthesis protein FlhG
MINNTLKHINLLHNQPENDNKRKMLMIASGKGGVGKTWFSITLAQALSMEKKSVLLFDGDLGLANVDIQLGLIPEKDLANVIDGSCSLKDAVTNYKMGGFHILAGRSGSSNLAQISIERFWVMMSALKSIGQEYDYVILDVGAGIGSTVKQMSRFVDECLVIITDEPTSITDAYALIKVSRQTNPSLNISIVINQAQDIGSGEKVFHKITNVCKRFIDYEPSLAGIVIKDSYVKEAIRTQSPLLTCFRNCQAANNVIDICKKYIDV